MSEIVKSGLYQKRQYEQAKRYCNLLLDGYEDNFHRSKREARMLCSLSSPVEGDMVVFPECHLYACCIGDLFTAPRKINRIYACEADPKTLETCEQRFEEDKPLFKDILGYVPDVVFCDSDIFQWAFRGLGHQFLDFDIPLRPSQGHLEKVVNIARNSASPHLKTVLRVALSTRRPTDWGWETGAQATRKLLDGIENTLLKYLYVRRTQDTAHYSKGKGASYLIRQWDLRA